MPAGETVSTQAAPEELADFITRYDRMVTDPWLQDYFGQTGFYNVGYWDADTRDQASACRTLVRKLVARLPDMPRKVLDAGCGTGGTTAELAAHFGAGAMTGINLSPAQVEACRARLPQSRFEVMDAARITFPEATFDAVFCIEAAFHFRTRMAFLTEAFRLLRPGGWLVAADITLSRADLLGGWMIPPDNLLDDPDAYTTLWQQAGFPTPQVEDVTAHTWRRFCCNIASTWQSQADRSEVDPELARQTIAHFRRLEAEGIDRYLLVSARKPG